VRAMPVLRDKTLFYIEKQTTMPGYTGKAIHPQIIGLYYFYQRMQRAVYFFYTTVSKSMLIQRNPWQLLLVDSGV